MNKKFKKHTVDAKGQTTVERIEVEAVRNERGKLGLVKKKTKELVIPYGDYDFLSGSIHGKPLAFLDKKNEDGIETFVGIYNTVSNKVLADHWEVVKEMGNYGYDLYFLKNPVTGKIHLFNEKTYGTKTDIFNKGYSKIKFLGNYSEFVLFALTDDKGKQAFFSTDKGFITGFEYDDIECYIRTIILTKDKKQSFILVWDKDKKRSKEYDRVKRDGKYVYCKSGDKWYVFLEDWDVAQLAFTVSCDNIEKIGEVGNSDRRNIKEVFLRKKGEKYGLMEGIVAGINLKDTTTRTLLDTAYDDIEIFPRREDVVGGAVVCFLVKDDKLGLFGYDVASTYSGRDYENKTETKYDRIKMVYGNNIFALYTDDVCDIYNLKENKLLLGNCDGYEVYKDYIIYTRGNKKGIYCIYNGENTFGYDDIVCIGYNLFVVDRRGKKGILHCTKERGIKKIIDVKYKSIKTGHARYSTPKFDETVYISLDSDRGDYELNILDLTEDYFKQDELTVPDNNKYKRIRFFENFFITENDQGVNVCSYNKGIVIKVFTPSTKVLVDKVDIGNDTTDLLIANNEYYVFINGEFFKFNPEEIPEYEYKYTSEYGEVVAVFHSKREYDKFISKTDRLSSKDMDDIFMGLYKVSPAAQEKYPKLMKQIGERD